MAVDSPVARAAQRCDICGDAQLCGTCRLCGASPCLHHARCCPERFERRLLASHPYHAPARSQLIDRLNYAYSPAIADILTRRPRLSRGSQADICFACVDCPECHVGMVDRSFTSVVRRLREHLMTAHYADAIFAAHLANWALERARATGDGERVFAESPRNDGPLVELPLFPQELPRLRPSCGAPLRHRQWDAGVLGRVPGRRLQAQRTWSVSKLLPLGSAALLDRGRSWVLLARLCPPR